MKYMLKSKRFIILISSIVTLFACNSSTALPPETLPGKWLVDSIQKKQVMQNSTIELSFHSNMSLTGKASCNNISSRYSNKNNTLAITPIATTRKICLPALMKQESQLLRALSKVKRFELKNGQLSMYDQQGTLQIKAHRIKR